MAAVVSGRVLGQGGDPVGGARVFFTAGPVDLPDIAELTGSDGSFALAAPAPGKYRLSAHGPWGKAMVELSVGSEDLSGLEFRLLDPELKL